MILLDNFHIISRQPKATASTKFAPPTSTDDLDYDNLAKLFKTEEPSPADHNDDENNDASCAKGAYLQVTIRFDLKGHVRAHKDADL